MSDEKLIDETKAFLGEHEQVVAAGMFQPRGTVGGMMGATGAGSRPTTSWASSRGRPPGSSPAVRCRTSTACRGGRCWP